MDMGMLLLSVFIFIWLVSTIVVFLPISQPRVHPSDMNLPPSKSGVVSMKDWVGGNSEARKRHEEKLAVQGEHAL
jgi:hypothetical protein